MARRSTTGRRRARWTFSPLSARSTRTGTASSRSSPTRLGRRPRIDRDGGERSAALPQSPPPVRRGAGVGGGMRFGFFDQLPCAGAFSERQRYRDLMAQIELGDAIGFDTVWLGELHFS